MLRYTTNASWSITSVEENLLHISHDEEITQVFETYVEREKIKVVVTLCAEEKLDETKVATLLDDYPFTI